MDGPPTSRTLNKKPAARVPHSQRPALSNGAAGLQDTAMGIGRNAGGQFRSISDQHT